MSGRWALGIDLGTTTSAAATHREGAERAELVRFGDGYRTSSAVLADVDGQLVAGSEAEREGALSPARVARRPKPQLGHGAVLLGEEWYEDVDLVAATLGHLHREAIRLHNGDQPDITALTHPVRWEAARQELLREAARRAGLGEVALLPEPVAAASALLSRGADTVLRDGDRVAVFDFGGGTLDIALLERRGGFVAIGPPGGDDHLGGDDVDERLIAHLVGQLPVEERLALLDPSSSADPDVWGRAAHALAREVRLAKEALAERRLVRIPLPAPPLSRAALELSEADLLAVAGPLVRSAVDRLASVLQRAGLEPAELAAIYLVGGSSRLVLVQRMLGRRFDVPISTFGDPKGLIALGAAEIARAEQSRSLQPAVPVGPTPGPRPARTTEPMVVAEPVATTPEPNVAPTVPVGRVPAAAAPVAVLAPPVPGALTMIVAALFAGFEPDAFLEHWLIRPGAVVGFGTPLAAVRTRYGSRVVASTAAGRIDYLADPTGLNAQRTRPDLTVLTYGALEASAYRPGALPPGPNGVLIEIAPSPAVAAGDVLVRVSGTPFAGLWTGGSFAFPRVPGKHGITVAVALGGRWRGVNSSFVTVASGQWPRLHYVPPTHSRGHATLA